MELSEAAEEGWKEEAPENQKDKQGKKCQWRIWEVKWTDTGATALFKGTFESVVIRDPMSDVMEIHLRTELKNDVTCKKKKKGLTTRGFQRILLYINR